MARAPETITVQHPRYYVALYLNRHDGIGAWQARNCTITPAGNLTLVGPDIIHADSIRHARRLFADYVEALDLDGRGPDGPCAELFGPGFPDDPYAAIRPDDTPVLRLEIGPRGGVRLSEVF
ncbi:MAG: hypothetical protein ACRDS9_00710 [Pseudonocardiaceae bacterium]